MVRFFANILESKTKNIIFQLTPPKAKKAAIAASKKTDAADAKKK